MERRAIDAEMRAASVLFPLAFSMTRWIYSLSSACSGYSPWRRMAGPAGDRVGGGNPSQTIFSTARCENPQIPR
jgi:hypothetical protein